MSLEFKKKNTPFQNDHSKRWLFVIPFITLTLLLVFVPLIMIIVKAFSPSIDGKLVDN
jgi:ABC-type sugar transport system permease subunit